MRGVYTRLYIDLCALEVNPPVVKLQNSPYFGGSSLARKSTQRLESNETSIKITSTDW